MRDENSPLVFNSLVLLDDAGPLSDDDDDNDDAERVAPDWLMKPPAFSSNQSVGTL